MLVLGAFVGAMAYTFSDTFWFSAVEGEVYATSSLFTAVVFWAILKWENVADEPGANRWLILIAYLIGLSIGVHLLNLLAIPAIVLVYYFKKYQVTRKGVIYALGISVVILLSDHVRDHSRDCKGGHCGGEVLHQFSWIALQCWCCDLRACCCWGH